MPIPGDRARLVGLCFSFFVLFFAFFASQSLVTPTLGSFGSLSLGLLYGLFAITGCVAPALLRALQRVFASSSSSSSPPDHEESLRASCLGLAVGAALYVPFIAACSFPAAHAVQLVGSALLGAGAGLLWVAQGSVLTACSTPTSRGRWAGIFWSCFMLGNAAGNATTSAIEAHLGANGAFRVLACVAAASVLAFACFVRPRSAVAAAAAEAARQHRQRERQEEQQQQQQQQQQGRPDGRAAPLLPAQDKRIEVIGVVAADRDGLVRPSLSSSFSSSSSSSSSSSPSPPSSASLGRDLRLLGSTLTNPKIVVLLPLLLFIGAENSFWAGAFPDLLSRLGAKDSIGYVIACLATSDMLTSLVAGEVADRCGVRPVLMLGLGAFCVGLAVVRTSLLPELPQRVGNVGAAEETVTMSAASSAAAFAAAALFGCGDAVCNTAAIATLGRLADDEGVVPRETAFQYFQVVNVFMTCLSFVYAPAIPLERATWQGSLQIYVLLVLAVVSGACVVACGGRSRR